MQNMNLQTERLVDVNKLIIKARWFYAGGIFLIGLFNNYFGQIAAIKEFILSTVFSIFVSVFLINFLLFLYFKLTKPDGHGGFLRFLSYFQTVLDLLIFAILVYSATEAGDVFFVFFVLPVVYSSTLSGPIGPIFASLGSIILLTICYILQKDVGTTAENVVNFSIFYGIIGLFSAFLSRAYSVREEMLTESNEKLLQEKKYRENEWNQISRTTKLLVSRDKELIEKNDVLDKKIKDLERSEKSMMKVFGDLKTERQKTENERNKTMAIISNFIDPIIVVNNDKKIDLFNPAAQNIFGLTDEVIGADVSAENDYSMENFKTIAKYNYEVKKPKGEVHDSSEEELLIKHGDQELTFRVMTAIVLDKRGGPLGVMKVFSNLTREKTLDKLKSDFISIAAHQLRTPLAAIKWVIKMVLDGDAGKLNEEQSVLLYKGYQSNERIIELVNDMLDVSRIEEGRFGYNFTDADYLMELKFVLDSLENKIKEKEIKLILNIPKDIPKLYMDRQRMTLVLQNIIENAVKYTPNHGKVEVAVEVSETFVRTSIKDNGVGIPEADQVKLFSKFFRATNVMRMQTEGSGLGLFIVKNIINKHGGDISFKSKEGLGTEFIFTLPLKSS